MEKKLHLTIVVPSKIYLEEEVASVILPAVRADINILPERAPSVFILDFGVVQILDASGLAKAKYFVRSGVAEIARNLCKVMVQDIVPVDSIKPYDAKRKVEAADEQERLFYQMILDYQRGIRRRYLRTLKLFSDKSGLPKTHEEVVADIRAEMAELEKRISAEKVSDKKEEA